jgi:hypothetical protein
MKTEQVIDVVNKLKAQAWNESITPRAESLLSYLRADIYQKGVLAYLKSMEAMAERKLLTGCKTRDDDQYMRGYLVALKEFIGLAEGIEAQVNAKKNPPAVPGEYTA